MVFLFLSHSLTVSFPLERNFWIQPIRQQKEFCQKFQMLTSCWWVCKQPFGRQYLEAHYIQSLDTEVTFVVCRILFLIIKNIPKSSSNWLFHLCIIKCGDKYLYTFRYLSNIQAKVLIQNCPPLNVFNWISAQTCISFSVNIREKVCSENVILGVLIGIRWVLGSCNENFLALMKEKSKGSNFVSIYTLRRWKELFYDTSCSNITS